MTYSCARPRVALARARDDGQSEPLVCRTVGNTTKPRATVLAWNPSTEHDAMRPIACTRAVLRPSLQLVGADPKRRATVLACKLDSPVAIHRWAGPLHDQLVSAIPSNLPCTEALERAQRVLPRQRHEIALAAPLTCHVRHFVPFAPALVASGTEISSRLTHIAPTANAYGHGVLLSADRCSRRACSGRAPSGPRALAHLAPGCPRSACGRAGSGPRFAGSAPARYW
jgi:hypothetical protein